MSTKPSGLPLERRPGEALGRDTEPFSAPTNQERCRPAGNSHPRGEPRAPLHSPGAHPYTPVRPVQGLGPLASPRVYNVKTETILEPPAFFRRVQVLYSTLQCLEKRGAFGRGFVESGGVGVCSCDRAPRRWAAQPASPSSVVRGPLGLRGPCVRSTGPQDQSGCGGPLTRVCPSTRELQTLIGDPVSPVPMPGQLSSHQSPCSVSPRILPPTHLPPFTGVRDSHCPQGRGLVVSKARVCLSGP